METKLWHDITVVKISSVEKEFAKWLYGQTIPMVEDDEHPFDWAYIWDYNRWKAKLPIVD